MLGVVVVVVVGRGFEVAGVGVRGVRECGRRRELVARGRGERKAVGFDWIVAGIVGSKVFQKFERGKGSSCELMYVLFVVSW